jgi:hypothetical protein
MLRTLERPLQAHRTDHGTGARWFLSPTLLARGETIYLLPDQDGTEYHRLVWRGEMYECLPQDLLASFAPRVTRESEEESSDEETQLPELLRHVEHPHLAQLAYQLANGVAYRPGDRVPVGWNSSRERIFIHVTREMLALASGQSRAA